MLRQGLNMADVAYYIGEDVPKMTGIQDPELPKGYQFDYINAEVLVRDASVKEGKITLPHGTSYRVLVLPKVNSMRPEVLSKIKQLVADGAVVLGPAPVCSPSLQNQPQADNSVKEMAQELWRTVDGKSCTSAQYGKGLIFDGVSLQEVFSKIDCPADCGIPADSPIKFGHRTMGQTDIYFVTNQSETVQKQDLTFRVQDMLPELWNPMDGTMRELTEFSCNGNGTVVPIILDKLESAFIVFRKKGTSKSGTKNFPQLVKLSDLSAPWMIDFKGKLTNPSPLRLERLQDVATFPADDVKHFSGNMIYTTTFKVDASAKDKEVYLDLGKVCFMAKVWVNDLYIGGVWTPPYRLNISSALKDGTNTLRIDVVNTWVNRLIGDSKLPKEQRETWVGMSPYTPESPLTESGLIGPVSIYKAQ